MGLPRGPAPVSLAPNERARSSAASLAALAPASPERESEGEAIRLEGVTRRFGTTRVLNRLDLTVPWDQRVAVLGANGSGKTTLLRILATLTRPTEGWVKIGGLALPGQAAAVRRAVGFVGHQTFLYDELTARENLTFYGRLYRVPSLAQRVDSLLARVGLAGCADERVRSLSRGLQQRVTLARAILHDPPILLLDEPDTGLDLVGADLLERLLWDEAGGRRTVVLTTHRLDLALDLADRVVILARGRIALDRPAAALSVAVLARAIRGEGEEA